MEDFNFYCPRFDCRMDESTCIQNRMNKKTKECCRTCNLLDQAATQKVYETLTAKAGPTTEISLNDNHSVNITLHGHLKLHACFDGLEGEAYVELHCKKYGSTHYHPDGNTFINDFCGFMEGSKVLLLKIGLFGTRGISFVLKDALSKHPKQYLFGSKVMIIDKDDCYDKKQYLQKCL